MKFSRWGIPVLTLFVSTFAAACASASRSEADFDRNVLTQEEIQSVQAMNLFEVVQRLRPRWLRVRGGTRSFNLETEIVVYQNGMLLGGPESLRQMETKIAYEIRWLDGARAVATLSGLSTGRHVFGAIVVYTRPPSP
ncbi:MAG: hypothetical protein ACC667_09475 [Longimicrobiales bacterium]